MRRQAKSSAKSRQLADLRKRFEDPNLRFPERPHLGEDIDIFRMPKGLGMQVRGQEGQPLIFRGRESEAAIEYLVTVLDGTNTLDAIIANSPKDVLKITLLRTLWSLFIKGLLRGPAYDSAQKFDEITRRELLYWDANLGALSTDQTPEQVRQRFQTTTLVLVGTGLFGVIAYDLLVRTGFSNLSVLAWDDDGFFSRTVNRHTLPPADTAILPTTSIEKATDELKKWIPGTDLLFTATRNAPSELFRAVNRLCLDEDVPWFRSNMNENELEAGPYVRPYDSPCYTCMQLREVSLQQFPVEERCYQAYLAQERPSGGTVPVGETLPFSTLAASIVVAEVVRITSGVTAPSLLGKVLTVSPLKGIYETHQFIRIPRCPDCFRGTIAKKGS